MKRVCPCRQSPAGRKKSTDHDHDTRITLGGRIRFGIAREWKKHDWQTCRVSLDPFEINADDLSHALLSFARCVDEMAITLNEQVQTIGLESLVDQRALNLEVTLHIVERGANHWKFDTVLASNGGENMCLDKIDEREILLVRIVQND